MREIENQQNFALNKNLITWLHLLYTGLLRWMHKNPTGARFITTSKICSTKQISKFVSNVCKLICTSNRMVLSVINGKFDEW